MHIEIEIASIIMTIHIENCDTYQENIPIVVPKERLVMIIEECI